jgi:aminopeptidase N
MVARDDRLDPAFRALALRLPSEDDMAQTLRCRRDHARPDGDLDGAREARAALASIWQGRPAGASTRRCAVLGPYTPDPKAAGRRALRQTALSLLSRIDGGARRRGNSAPPTT